MFADQLRGTYTTPGSPVHVDDLPTASTGSSGGNGYGVGAITDWNGDKWCGSFGQTKLYDMDYWTLRERSRQLFADNLYARGLIRRLVTNVINVGLHLECEPEEAVLGLADDELVEWSESVETLFALWGDSPACDHLGRYNWGRLQAFIKRQALVDGDILVIVHSRGDGSIKIETTSGGMIDTPPAGAEIAQGHSVEWGVEWDAAGREVAYWVRQRDDSFKRIAAFGRRTGRRMAKLIRGQDGLTCERRGEPALGIMLHSIKDLDRYRDATIRKATINAILAMWVEKTEDKIASKSLAGTAQRKGTQTVVDDDGTTRERVFRNYTPGVVLEELQTGEKIHAHNNAGTDQAYSDFESAIVNAFAWAQEVPPEILQLAFSSNYSASQAATNEFKLYLNKERARFGDELCNWVYEEWALTEAQANRLPRGNDLLEAYRSRRSDYRFRAWMRSDWTGAIKPSTDMAKAVKAYREAVAEGAIDRERMARELFGTKFTKVARKLKKQNQQLAEANQVLVDQEKEPAAGGDEPVTNGQLEAAMTDLLAEIEDITAPAAE